MHHTIKPSITRVPLCGPLMLVIKHHLTGHLCFCALYTVFWTFSPFSFNYDISLAADKTDLYIFFTVRSQPQFVLSPLT